MNLVVPHRQSPPQGDRIWSTVLFERLGKLWGLGTFLATRLDLQHTM